MTTLADVGSELDWLPLLWVLAVVALFRAALWLGERWERAGRVIDGAARVLDGPEKWGDE